MTEERKYDGRMFDKDGVLVGYLSEKTNEWNKRALALVAREREERQKQRKNKQ